MATVAEMLRDAREHQNLTINQIAEITKIRTDHLRALEEGNYDVFMAPVYIKGFVRCYANLLRLDVPTVMGVLEAELQQTKKFSEPPALTNNPKGVVDYLMLQLSKLNWSLVLPVAAFLLVLFLSIVGYQAYRRHKAANPLADLGPGIHQPKPELTEVYLPVPTNAVRR